MNLNSIYYIFLQKQTKSLVICTVTGGLLQFFCSRYIKDHPEFLEEPQITIEIKHPSGKTDKISNEISKRTITDLILKRLRGGQIPEKLAQMLLQVILKKLVKLAAKKGVEIGVSTGIGVAVALTPKKQLVKLIEGSLPQNLLDKENFIILDGEKEYLENCGNDFRYMFSLLMDKELPYSEKKELVTAVFRVQLDNIKPLQLILCLIPLLLILSTQNPSGYYLVLQNLIKAIKEGRISKAIARVIVRKLLKKGKFVDPELLDLLND